MLLASCYFLVLVILIPVLGINAAAAATTRLANASSGSERQFDDHATSQVRSSVSAIKKLPSIHWPLDSPTPITFPNADSSHPVNAPFPTCNGRLYGRNLNLASCLNALYLMSSDDEPLTFGDRTIGRFDGPLPYRYLSRDGRCAIDFAHAAGVDFDTATPQTLREAARLVIQICVSIDPNQGGLITGLGQNKGLAVRVVPYRPTVTCGPSGSGPPWVTCRDILDFMDADNKPQVFGPRGEEQTTVAIPYAYTSERQRCGITVDTTEAGHLSDKGTWYKIWAAATAIDFICCQLGRRGVAVSQGDNKRLFVELKDVRRRDGMGNGTVATA